MAAPTVFAALFVALYAAHQVADHWVQTDAQAAGKGAPGWPGRLACGRHVASMTAVKVAAVSVTVAVLGLRVSWLAVAAALAADAASHYWADRRFTLARLAARCGSAKFYALGSPRPGHDDGPHIGTGAYALDQSFHIGALFLAALIASVGAA